MQNTPMESSIIVDTKDFNTLKIVAVNLHKKDSTLFVSEEEVCKVDKYNFQEGEWKTTVTPDGFFLFCQKDMFNDFETVFDFDYFYKNVYSKPQEIFIMEDEQKAAMEVLEAGKQAKISSDYLGNCIFNNVGIIEADCIYITGDDGEVLRNKKNNQVLLRDYKELDFFPRIDSTGNTLRYNCFDWEGKINVDLIKTPIFDEVSGVILRPEFNAARRKKNSKSLLNNMPNNGPVFHWQ